MKLEKIDIKKIKPYPNNPRKNDSVVDKLCESIKQCGYSNPIIVDEDMVVLAGHTRLKALTKLGYKEVEVGIVTGLTEEQKRKYRLYDNKAGELAGWDYTKLRDEVDGLDFGDLVVNWGLDENSRSTDYKNTEYDVSNFGDEVFKYECPCCGFRFNK